MLTGYVPGGFDMLHIGHLNILSSAAARCDRLIVGVATDDSLEHMKGRAPNPIAHIFRRKFADFAATHGGFNGEKKCPGNLIALSFW